jgi:hypothetical protein
MPFSDEDKQFIQEIIQSVVTEKVESIQTEFTRQVDGLAAKTKKMQGTAISDLTQQITSLTEELNTLKKPSEPSQEKPTQPSEQPNEELTLLQNQLQELKSALSKEQEARRVAETQRVLSNQQTKLVTSLNGKVVDPNSFFTLAVNDGLIKQGKSSDGSDLYYLEKKDPYGDSQSIPLISEEGITMASQLVEQKYPFLVAPRPGNGGGTSAGGTPNTVQRQYFGNEVNGDKITKAFLSGNQDEVLRELDRLAKES